MYGRVTPCELPPRFIRRRTQLHLVGQQLLIQGPQEVALLTQLGRGCNAVCLQARSRKRTHTHTGPCSNGDGATAQTQGQARSRSNNELAATRASLPRGTQHGSGCRTCRPRPVKAMAHAGPCAHMRAVVGPDLASPWASGGAWLLLQLWQKAYASAHVPGTDVTQGSRVPAFGCA